MSDPWTEITYSVEYANTMMAARARGYNAALAAVRPEYDRVCAERDELRRTVSELRHRLAFYEPPPKAKQ